MTLAYTYKTNLQFMIAVVMRSSRRMEIANGVWKEFIMEMIKNCHWKPVENFVYREKIDAVWRRCKLLGLLLYNELVHSWK